MRLARFQLSGFKSFARSTALEFTHPITAIVGPNGSGKSNIAEGIRWVLGEQSIKSLRGKKGEDLIFNGSPQAPRTGKASVKLFFDNHDGKIPMDFDEVVFERKIFRDGTNEYYLNDSQVRLRDVVELLARMGLGETKHNIIGQGEVDRILFASPRERREMLEEAIGLRVYQLKKTETERKLDETSKNIVQVQAIIKEISPHLKFLKLQAEKAENREAVDRQLREATIAWVLSELNRVDEELRLLEKDHAPEEKRLAAIENEIQDLEKAAAALEEKVTLNQKATGSSEKIEEAERERQKLLLELGRIEGRLERANSAAPIRERMVEAVFIRRHLTTLLDHLEEVHVIDDLEEVREKIQTLISDIETLLAEIEEASIGEKTGVADKERERLEESMRHTRDKLSILQKEIEEMKGALEKRSLEFNELGERLRKYERILREKEEEKSGLRAQLQRWFFDKERSAERRKEIEEEMTRAGIGAKELETFDLAPFSSVTADELKRKMDRYRVRLEEIGGIDPVVVKEYQEVKTRHDFLEKEVDDLEKASRDLRILIKELEETMEKDFEVGFKNIKEEFNNYFRIIFGGGKGVLKYVPLERRESEDNDNEESKESTYGIEIDVDVPQKRIQSLNMLSGGERALTSIALLFAITAVNPPPFLVLDETDAALDEANSQKYAAILRQLSKKSQLIIITHNRETMKQAGILYGVTMGGDGVSKLLSLKLEEAEVYTSR